MNSDPLNCLPSAEINGTSHHTWPAIGVSQEARLPVSAELMDFVVVVVVYFLDGGGVKLKKLKVEINHSKSWMKCYLSLLVSMELVNDSPH